MLLFFLPLKTQLRGFGGFVHSGLYRKSSEYESIAGTLNLTRCSFGEQCAVVTVGFFYVYNRFLEFFEVKYACKG